MDRSTALVQMPRVYARALGLRAREVDEPEIARALRVAPEGMAAPFTLAEAKLARVLDARRHAGAGHGGGLAAG